MKDNLDKDTIHQYMMQQGKNGYATPKRLTSEQRKVCRMRRKIEAINEICWIDKMTSDGWEDL